MTRPYLQLILLAAVLAIAVRALISWPAIEHTVPVIAIGATSTTPIAITQTPGVEVKYINTELNFSFDLLSGLTVQETQEGPADGMLMKLHGSDGLPVLTILATPWTGAAKMLTQDLIEKLAPGKEIANPTPVSIAPGITGLAFESTSASWGPSAELWFSYKGHLYQLSTALANKPLLDFVWGSWGWR